VNDSTETPQLPTPADVTLRGNSRSSSIGALAGALAKAQGAVKNPLRERKVKIKTKQGYEYSFFYADLAACLEVARPVLSANGLAIVQSCSVQGRDAVVVTELMHTSGEWVRSELAFRASDDIKELAGVFTYLRRYAISPIIGIAPEDDDQIEQSQAQPEPAKGKDPKYQNISVSEPKPAEPPKGNGSRSATQKAAAPESTSVAARAEAAPSAAVAAPSTHDRFVERAEKTFDAKVVSDTRKTIDTAPLADDFKDDLWDLAGQLWPSDTKQCLNDALKERKKKPVDFRTITVGEAREVHALVTELLGNDGSEAPF